MNTLRKLAAPAACIVGLALLTGCMGGGDGEADPGELRLSSWAGELPDSIVAAFEAETGISVIADTHTGGDIIQATLAAGGSGYDLVEIGHSTIARFAGMELIQPIDHSRIDGMDNILPAYLDQVYDPGNEYSVPWVTGTTGLIYNAACTGEEITSWSSLFDDRYAGKIYMLDNSYGNFIPALQLLGSSVNEDDPAIIEKATQMLIDQKPLIAGYNQANQIDFVATGEACLAMAYSGSQAANAAAENPDVKYVLPKEGGTVWVDSWTLVADAPNADNAYRFLSFLNRPDIAAMATNEGNLATVNEGALDLIEDSSLLDNAAVFPPVSGLEKAEYVLDLGEKRGIFQEAWTRILAS